MNKHVNATFEKILDRFSSQENNELTEKQKSILMASFKRTIKKEWWIFLNCFYEIKSGIIAGEEYRTDLHYGFCSQYQTGLEALELMNESNFYNDLYDFEFMKEINLEIKKAKNKIRYKMDNYKLTYSWQV